jgi:hypothetical protein
MGGAAQIEFSRRENDDNPGRNRFLALLPVFKLTN